jgi:hypothetical protein
LGIKAKTDPNTVIVGEFYPPVEFSPVARSSRQKVHKETLELSDIIYQKDLTDIYTKTFFSAAHGTVSKNSSYLRT